MPALPGAAFELLDPFHRFVLPAAGGLVLGVAYWLLPATSRTVGIVHVLERLHYHQGRMPGRNLVVQFIGGAVALSGTLSGFVFGIGTSDPLTYTTVAALLATVAFVGCWLPARRATMVDPVSALKSE